ncbi:MAG TPA: Hsp33 family molecular chaperone HslO, partial [Geobacteraceae bacterium]|nr:Hsp33 family molecular chaperone HslO [Geobacteraceae bacterium]
MKDYLVRIVTKTENIRALACVTTGLVHEACRRHGTYPAASAALGRALTGGSLLGALMKTGQRVGLRFEGSGPLRKIIVEADSNGAVRGYVGVPDVHMVTAEGKLDVGGALGRAGFLTVTKDLGLKEPYKGMVQLYTSEIAEDIAYYLTESEQIPSAVGLGVFVEPDNSVSASGGFLIQSLPPADERVIDMLMERIGRMLPVTQFLHEGGTPETLLESLFADIPFVALEKRELAFLCTCTREKIEQVLISLG